MIKFYSSKDFCFLLLFFVVFKFSAAQHSETNMMYIDTSYHKVNERFFIDTTGVSIVPPAHYLPFVQNDKWGFIHKGAASTIQVQIFDGVIYTMLSAGLTAEELLKQNVTLKEHYMILTNDNQKADLFVVSFFVKGLDKDLEYERLMLLTGDHTRTIWINANYPVIAKSVVFNVLKESLLSVEF